MGRNIERAVQVGWAAESAERRENNRASGKRILIEAGAAVTDNSGGVHLVAKFGTTVVDFWPGTGRFRVRGSDVDGRGVFSLLKRVGATHPQMRTK